MFVLHLIDNRRAHVKTVGRIRHANAAAIGNNFRAFLFAARDQAHDAIAMLPGNDRAHVGLRFRVGRADFDGARRFDQRRQNVIGRFADGDGGRSRHATFAGATKRRGGKRFDRARDVRVRHDDDVIFRAAICLHAFAVARAGFINVFRDRRRTDKRNRFYFRMREQRIDTFAAAVEQR